MSRIAAAEQSLPIDIHYNKLQHWLVDRRAIPSKWALHLSTARTLTRVALFQTPAALQTALDIPSLTPHQHLPSLTVHQVCQQLTTTPNDPTQSPLPSAPPLDKDLLGRFKSPLLRAWYAAVSAFEHHATYLVDAAHHLTHNVNHEAPALKSSIARLSRTISESSRRESQLRQRFLNQYNFAYVMRRGESLLLSMM